MSAMTMINDDLQFHAFCLAETGTRLDQFQQAIRQRVKAGDVVVDLGAGSGILSFLACHAGARRVYAVEAGGSLAFARVLAARNGLANRIEFINLPSTRAVIPERAHVIVGDIHDTFGLQSLGLTAFIDARERFLLPGGTIIPARLELMMAPVDAAGLYEKTIDLWHRPIHGVDVSPLRTLAVNQPNAARFEREQLLTVPAVIATIDLMTAQRASVAGSAVASVTRAGTMHGLCGCFVTTLADDVLMGNVPGDSGTTNFAQVFFPIDRPILLVPGDHVSMRADTHDGSAARWQVEITRAGRTIATFDHSTLQSEPLSMESLRKQADDYRPSLTTLGALERELLGHFDGTRSAAELEAWIAERHRAVLPSAREAAVFLKVMIERCG
jgi:type I protein arginine methyltransferase